MDILSILCTFIVVFFTGAYYLYLVVVVRNDFDKFSCFRVRTLGQHCEGEIERDHRFLFLMCGWVSEADTCIVERVITRHYCDSHERTLIKQISSVCVTY